MRSPQIIYEDSEIIVCHKPAGMATQTKRLGQQDMDSYLKNYRASKNEPPYIGIVHRLDQPVEGVMVFAKNKEAAADLSKQVQERIIGKHYYAVCLDNSKSDLQSGDKARVEDYMLIDKKNNVSRIVLSDTPHAKKAVLDYEVIRKEHNKMFFEITLHTGRQHQIRLQLSNIGYPIIGDIKYGGIPNNQLMLCSYKLEIEHPKNHKRMEFKIDCRFLDKLKILE